MNLIYKITDLYNGKVYIGQTCKCVNARFKVHLSGRGNYFIGKYYKLGHKFSLEIIMSVLSKKDLNYYEKFMISYYNCQYPNGYNLTEGGDYDYRVSDFSRKKASESQLKRFELFGNPLKGVPKTEGHRIAMSKSRKGFDSENRKLAREKAFKKNKIPIIAINLSNGEFLYFDSTADCAKSLKLERRNINAILKGRNGRVSHKGYTFEYQYRENTTKKFKKPKYYTKDKLGNYIINYKRQYIGYVKNLEDVKKILDKLNNNSYNSEEFSYCLLKHKKPKKEKKKKCTE